MEKIKISAVSYLNTFPFLYGIFKNKKFLQKIQISTDYPAVCAEKLITNKVDIGLIPVAALPRITNYKIITDFCISAYKQVKSVMLFSEVPLKNIDKILLDYQSISSINLTKVLSENYWKISPKWENTLPNIPPKIKGNTAAVIIGDKALNELNKHKFTYDLAQQWYEYTNLPFVFATWTTNKKIPEDFILELNKCLKFGIENIDDTLIFFKNELNKIHYDAKEYLSNNISYHLDNKKKSAINLFLKKL